MGSQPLAGSLTVPRAKDNRRVNRESGTTLIELLAAFTVLIVGMTGGLLLLVLAITTNNSNHLDTSATALAELTLEQLAARPSGASGATLVTIRDCRSASAGGSQTWTLDTTGSASGNGANINATTGEIDFLQAYAQIPTNYKMTYVACAAQGRSTSFDLRVNIHTLTKNTRLVTVGARAQTSGRQFQQPVTIRTIVGY
jgi:type II secretory pathway pseudopilin PulG